MQSLQAASRRALHVATKGSMHGPGLVFASSS